MNKNDDKISRLASLTLAMLLVAISFVIHQNVARAENQNIPQVIEEPQRVVPEPIKRN